MESYACMIFSNLTDNATVKRDTFKFCTPLTVISSLNTTVKI